MRAIRISALITVIVGMALGAIIWISPSATSQTTENPHGKIAWDCLDCHNTASWSVIRRPIAFNHDLTGFALIGAHSATDCRGCHKDLRFSHIGTSCADCHADIHRGQFGVSCETCHSPQNWKNRRDAFELHAARGFSLIGVHAIADCDACHINQQRNEFAGAPVDCQGCHLSNYAAAADPNHARAGFGDNCQECHLPVASSWNNSVYQHTPAFALNGAHARTDCNSCHGENYAGTSNICYDCHTQDYNDSNDPSHAAFGFPTNCEACHTDIAWDRSTFDHLQASGFEIRGAHNNILCIDCHVNNQLNGLPQECFGCHQDDYTAVADPSHVQGNFPHDCLLCHSENVWNPATFDHAQSGFPLTGAHTTTPCASCHSSGYTNTPTDCYSCHQADYTGATDPNHAQNNFSHICGDCHTTNGWEPATFNHANTRFPLTGAHIPLSCISCHSAGYQNTPIECYACHQSDFENARDPNHVSNNFSHDCTQCHSTAGWDPATFNHANTDFPLTGAHVSLTCISCHASGYQNTPTDCYSCHQADYDGVSDPNHLQNNFDHDCTVCHTTAAWEPATFNHNNTAFPLTGAHVSLNCVACHANGYQNTPTDCFSCHEADYIGAEDHVRDNYPHDCTLCHNTSDWGDNLFNHGNTQFPLTGAHVSLDCLACHAGGYQNVSPECYACHQSDYDNVTDPNHIQNNFDHLCTQCHNTSAWNPTTFGHENTQFPLTGAHVAVTCVSCHLNGYQNTPRECYACHETDYGGVPDPNHIADNFSQICTQCHTTAAWLPATYDHNLSPFPLTGAHVSLPCVSCHAGGYDNTSSECYSCHQADYNSIQDPNHVSNNFDHVCTVCHTTAAWTPVNFSHANTQFPLTGAHTSVPCISCHAGGYDNTPIDCYSCHQADFDGVNDPNHIANNFDHVCTVCHTTAGWTPANFNHANTDFPLTGAHTTAPCISCHAGGYQNTPTDCYSCHQPDFDGVTDPNHIQNNFSHICNDCHTTNAWSPATFDHNLTSFPLTGAHTTLTCLACHSSGYQNTPTDCYACHQADYNNSTDPNHQAMGFPTTCQQCHSTAAWEPSTWNHDAQYFPIFSGRHQGRWAACVDCHQNPNDFNAFECILCHEHNRQETDGHHVGVPGYQYNSNACYNCHPSGNG